MNKEFGRSSYYFETDDEMPDFLEERPDFSSVKKVTGEQYYYEMFDEEFAEAKAILKKIEEEERKSHDSLKREINFQKERERVKDQNRSERLYGFGGPEIQAQCKSAEDLGREQRKEVQLSAVPASTPTYVHYKSAEELVMERKREVQKMSSFQPQVAMPDARDVWKAWTGTPVKKWEESFPNVRSLLFDAMVLANMNFIQILTIVNSYEKEEWDQNRLPFHCIGEWCLETLVDKIEEDKFLVTSQVEEELPYPIMTKEVLEKAPGVIGVRPLYPGKVWIEREEVPPRENVLVCEDKLLSTGVEFGGRRYQYYPLTREGGQNGITEKVGIGDLSSFSFKDGCVGMIVLTTIGEFLVYRYPRLNVQVGKTVWRSELRSNRLHPLFPVNDIPDSPLRILESVSWETILEIPSFPCPMDLSYYNILKAPLRVDLGKKMYMDLRYVKRSTSEALITPTYPYEERVHMYQNRTLPSLTEAQRAERTVSHVEGPFNSFFELEVAAMTEAVNGVGVLGLRQNPIVYWRSGNLVTVIVSVHGSSFTPQNHVDQDKVYPWGRIRAQLGLLLQWESRMGYELEWLKVRERSPALARIPFILQFSRMVGKKPHSTQAVSKVFSRDIYRALMVVCRMGRSGLLTASVWKSDAPY